MNSVLIFLAIGLALMIVFLLPIMIEPSYVALYGPISVFDTSLAVLMCALFASVAGLFTYRSGPDGSFLLKLFVAALLIRVFVGAAIFVFNAQEFFGGDALTYDFFGYAQMQGWGGDRYAQSLVTRFIGEGEASGWGMVYFVAAIYSLIGRNMLATQFVNGVMGAVTAPIIFLCAQHVYDNTRVARLAGIAVAFYPSLVLWSSQGLKDGPIVFFLALAMLATVKLGERFSVTYLAVLVCSMFSLLSLRFYVFYMISVAIGGAFVIGMQKVTATRFLRQFVIMIVIGLALTYMGITRYANVQFEQFGSLERVQISRHDASTSAKSGFGGDVDVSTTEGALSTIPTGLIYLLFAPFPWQLASLRQSITLPEMIIWWVSAPMLVLGVWYSIKFKLRMISPILIFTAMLSLAYSVFQGNVGTAYRQRAQLLVFYFVFVAVGYTLVLEKREERKRALAEREAHTAKLPGSALQQR